MPPLPAPHVCPACKVVIIDGHQAVRELLREALTRAGACHYEVPGLGGSVREAVELCRQWHPDVLILEMLLPDGSGVEAIRQVRSASPGSRVVFFTGSAQTALVTQAVGLGTKGYVLKSRPLHEVTEVIARVCAGGSAIDPGLFVEASAGGNTPDPRLLTRREREVTRLIAQGRTTKEAANDLGISVKTLDKHRSNLMRKLKVHDVVGLTHYAIACGLISLN